MIKIDYAKIGTEVEVFTNDGNYKAKVVEKPFYDPKKKIAIS